METKLAAINEAINQFLAKVPSEMVLAAKNWHNLPNGTDADFAHECIRLGRVLKTFEIPRDGSDEMLAQKAIHKCLEFDKQLGAKGSFLHLRPNRQIPSGTIRRRELSVDTSYYERLWFNDSSFRKMCYYIRSNLQEFRVDWSLADFGPGDTFFNEDDRRSAIAKLSRGTLESTRCALKYFEKHVAYSHKTWRLVLASRGYKKLKAMGCSFQKLMLLAKSNGCKVTDYLIRWGLRTIEIVAGSRITTVPKDNDTRRVINIEPLINVYLQKGVGASLKKFFKKRLGIDLFLNQELHGRLIAESHRSTIDFSNASQSISVALMKFVMPRFFFKLLDGLRSKLVMVNDDWVRPNCFSFMGNGFTFEILTLFVHAAGMATVNKDHLFSYAYGDDAIVSNDAAPAYIKLMQSLGFQVNETKSFVNREIRESCGKFFAMGEYVITYKLPYVDSWKKAISAANKVYLFATSKRGTLQQAWMTLWKQITEHLEDFRGTLPHEADIPTALDLWCWDPGFSAKRPETQKTGLLAWLTSKLGIEVFTVKYIESETTKAKPKRTGLYRKLEIALWCDLLMRPSDVIRNSTREIVTTGVVSLDGRFLGSYKSLREMRTRELKLQRSWDEERLFFLTNAHLLSHDLA